MQLASATEFAHSHKAGETRMKKLVLIAVAMLAMSAQAAQTNNGCQGNCPDSGGTTTNQGGIGYGGTGVGIGIGGSGGAGGNGGAGGAGGAGGQGGAGGNVVGSGNSSATGGSVLGSGNSRNDLSQGQGQHQGQSQSANNKQGQSQNSRNDNQSSASNANTNSNAGNNSAQSTQVGGDTYVSNYRAATNSAYAPPIAPTSMCMGSSSAGGTGMTFGFSIGTSWTDSNCQLLEQVRTVAVAIGDKETAAAMMCSVQAYREAREKSGKPC